VWGIDAFAAVGWILLRGCSVDWYCGQLMESIVGSC